MAIVAVDFAVAVREFAFVKCALSVVDRSLLSPPYNLRDCRSVEAARSIAVHQEECRICCKAETVSLYCMTCIRPQYIQVEASGAGITQHCERMRNGDAELALRQSVAPIGLLLVVLRST